MLMPHEPAPFESLDTDPAIPALVLCDHASNKIPEQLGGLGVPPASLDTHFALDIGAAAVTRYLHERLSLPAILTSYSRLVVDCNRALNDPSAFPECLENIDVPGNRALTHDQRQDRADSLYWPYHNAVRDRAQKLETLAAAPALISIHSFTPELAGHQRPWHIGILWDKDPRIALPLLADLEADPAVVVGDNEPYSGRHPHDFTMDHHAEANGLPHVSIEIRQDLIEAEEGVRHWSERLANALLPILEDKSLYSRWSG